MGSEADQDNIIPDTLDDLDEEERQKYMVVVAHLQNGFLKDFKKDRDDKVVRVQEFVMPSFKMNDDKIKVLDAVSSSPQPSTPINAVSQIKDSSYSVLTELSAR